MSLYAIGDLHLHFQSELKAPGQLHEPVWKDHEAKFKKNCEELIQPDDTLVLAGDHSWGRNLSECEKDLAYISGLPGRKILTRGNHDMFWDVKKTVSLNERFSPALTFLQDSFPDVIHIPADMAILPELSVVKPPNLFQDHLLILQMPQDMAPAGGSDIYGKIILLHAFTLLCPAAKPCASLS